MRDKPKQEQVEKPEDWAKDSKGTNFAMIMTSRGLLYYIILCPRPHSMIFFVYSLALSTARFVTRPWH